MERVVKCLIELSAAVVEGRAPDPERLKEVDLEALYKLADFQLMTGIAGAGLEMAGIKDERFVQALAKAIRKNLLHDSERRRVTAKLEEAGIWYMPLKGAILKDYYPKLGTRQMSDNDILFDPDRAQDVRDIMEGLGFECIHYGVEHQDDYQKPPVCHFEMHRALFSDQSDERLFKYYQDVEKRLIPVKGCERRFSEEDFYIYMIAHEFKHHYWNGTGLRSLLDVYVFLRKKQGSLDWDYIRRELDILGIAQFEEQNRELAEKLFSGRGEGLTDQEAALTQRFVTSGAYGTEERNVQNYLEKEGKSRYIFRRIFLPMKDVERIYPYFYSHKYLLPVLPIYRLFKNRGNAKKEIDIIRRDK